MNTSAVEQLEHQCVHSINPALQPSGHKSGYLLVTLITLASIAAIAYGCSLLIESPFLIGIVPAALVSGTKMYFIRYRTLYERTISGGWDRVFGYLISAFLSVFLAALGFFGVSGMGGAKLADDSMLNGQWREAVIKIESYYSEMRSQIERRIGNTEEMLSYLQGGDSAIAKSPEIERLENEINELKRFLRDLPTTTNLPKTISKSKGMAFEEENSDHVILFERLGQEIKKAARLQNRLPDAITVNTDLPKVEPLRKNDIPDGLLKELLADTLSQSPTAVGCWILPAMLEALVLILVLHNRPRHYGE
jgi:hypothetical protein